MAFTPDTLITTKRGDVAVQDLRPGDLVKTRDAGYQQILWVGKKSLSGREFLDAPHLRPVLIHKDAFGHGLPSRDMMVTPNHRIPVSSGRTSLVLPSRKGLVAAKNLVDHVDVLSVECVGTQYINLCFSGHQMIKANGLWVENFDCEDASLGGVGNSQRNEIFELFHDLHRYTIAHQAVAAVANGPRRSQVAANIRTIG